MTKPKGRTDDMLIIRGVNVFPSQIETVLLNKGYPANYQIIVDRVNNTDTLDVQVEMTPEMFTDNIGEISARRKNSGGRPEVHARHQGQGDAGCAEEHHKKRRQGSPCHRQEKDLTKEVTYGRSNRYPFFWKINPVL